MGTIKHKDWFFDDDESIDYTNLIAAAVAAGDMAKAGYLEKSRNTKIDYYGMPYEKTYEYQDYIPAIGTGSEKESKDLSAPSFYKGTGATKAGMNNVMNTIRNTSFSYNPESDPLFKSIKDNYKKSADLITEDVLGSYAGMTGGMPSSYAVSAATATGNRHMQKADDMIPELYQLAYNKFADEKDDLYKQYGIMQGLEEQEYSRGIDERDYADYLDEKRWSRDTYLDEQEYQKGVDERMWAEDDEEDAIRDESNAQKKADKVKEEAQNSVMTSLSIGVPPSQADLDASGWFEGMTPEQVLASYGQANAPKVTYPSGGAPKKTDLKRPTTAMFNAVDDLFENGDGTEGLSKLMSKYDWETYDKSIIDEYIKSNYGEEDGILEYLYGDVDVDEWVDKINSALYDAWVGNGGNKNGNSRMAANESRKPHIYSDKNGYRLAGDITPTDVAEILFNSSLTNEQVGYILERIGISEDEVDL